METKVPKVMIEEVLTPAANLLSRRIINVLNEYLIKILLFLVLQEKFLSMCTRVS